MNNKSNKSKPTHLYASISVAIVLFLLGLFFIVFIHTQDLANILKEKVNIIVELKQGDNGKEILKELSSNQDIVKSSISYIPKEQGLDFMTHGNSIDFDGDNPLRDIVVFNVKSSSYSDEVLKNIKKKLMKSQAVSGVYYENMVLETIKANLKKLATIILLLGVVFIFLAIIIIRNTINLSMYADRDEILTLQRIGANWSFIKMPYIKSSVIVGFKGWIMAIVLLVTIFSAISINFPTIWSSLNMWYILLCVILLLGVAVLIPAWVSNSAANKYLKVKF